MTQQISILDMMKMCGEDSCKAVLSTFMCPLNLDVEDFIHNKAIYDDSLDRFMVSMPLIAQLGRNFDPTAVKPKILYRLTCVDSVCISNQSDINLIFPASFAPHKPLNFRNNINMAMP